MGDPRLDDDVGLRGKNRLLDANHVVWQLDDRPPHPREAVRILPHPADGHPEVCDPIEALFAEQVQGDRAAILFFDGHRLGASVDRKPHEVAFR